MDDEELDREQYEFKRDIESGAINSRTGKIMAEKVLRWFEDSSKTKVSLVNHQTWQTYVVNLSFRVQRLKSSD